MAILFLVCAAIIPYLPAVDSPWYFDDVNNIVDNPLIRDLPRAVRGLFEGRGVAMLSFALNFHFGGLDTTGYHLTNIAIHAVGTLLVWQLLRRLPVGGGFWALAGALLFALHPVQTQGVTYIVQRMSSLSALFFLAATLCYLNFLDRGGRHRRLFYALALLCGALSVLTKENAAVLPLALLLVERSFRSGRSLWAQLASIAPFGVVPAWKAVAMLLRPVWQGDVAASVRYADQLQNLQNVTPLRYLFTEFSVFWYYLKLFLFPVGLRLDYSWPVVERLLTAPNLVALAGLLLLAAGAWSLRRSWPLAAFGLAWFFLTLSVESSFIPLDPIFEHRLYLPLFGLVLAAIDLLRRIPAPRAQQAVVVAVLAVLAVLTWQRNHLWADQIAFFEDNLQRSPDNVRVMVMLGNAYATAKRPDDGLRMIEAAMQRNPRYDFAYTALGKIHIDRGEGGRAIPALLRGLALHPDSILLNEYLGIAYGEVGELRTSLHYFQRALELQPEDASVITNIGVLYSRLGDDRRAVEYFERSLQLVPDSEKTLYNLASALYVLGENRRALAALQAVTRVNPGNADAQYGRGALALEFGELQETMAAATALRRLGDERAGELEQTLSGER